MLIQNSTLTYKTISMMKKQLKDFRKIYSDKFAKLNILNNNV